MTESGSITCLIISTDDDLDDAIRKVLHTRASRIDRAASQLEIADSLEQREFDITFADLDMPGQNLAGIVDQIQRSNQDSQIILLPSQLDTEVAVAALKKGGFDFLTKPVNADQLTRLVDRALERNALLEENRELQNRLEKQIGGTETFHRIVRSSPAMEKVTRTVKQVAMSGVPVLLRGETGVGKELIARTIHERSRRVTGPFVAVNCGGFTEDLFSSELFGHVRGAYTGAYADRPGRFALAEGGTLFLDEIGEVPLKNQVELLRVLESKEYQPLGDTKVHEADVRIIAATNRDLEAGVKSGEFRDDLYYRLNVVPVDIPPLRQRQEDLPVLVETFFEESCRAYDQPRKKVSPDAMNALLRYPWPGNVRELRNVIQRLVVTSAGTVILPSGVADVLGESSDEVEDQDLRIPLGASIRDMEAELIRMTLQRVTSNRREAATILGISVRSLQYKLKEYDIK